MSLPEIFRRLGTIVRGVVSGDAAHGSITDQSRAGDPSTGLIGASSSDRKRQIAASAGSLHRMLAQPNPSQVSSQDQSVPRRVDRVAASASSTMRGLTWVGAGASVKIGGSGPELRDPLAYFFVERAAQQDDEPSAVNLNLSFALRPQQPIARELPYWPRYDQLNSNQRGIYLAWLASGRKSVPPELGYTFLFIYGLERRVIADEQDAKPVFKEIFRLRQIYERSGQPVSRSFDRYTTSFLWFLLLRDGATFSPRYFEALAKSISIWDEDSLANAMSWLAVNNQPLPAWLAFCVAGQLPKSQRSVVVRRVGNELRDLFSKRYKDRFADGLTLKSSKRDRKVIYKPASNVLPTLELAAPNPMGILSQFNVLSTLWNECILNLKKLSSAVAGSTGEAMTIKAWNALPAELRSGVDHPLTDQFSHFIEEHTGDSPQTIVDARSLATLAGIASSAKLTVAACRRMADTVENVGYCIEPDVRITGRAYEADQPVALFLNLGEGTIDAGRYTAASTMLSVGLALAQLIGTVDEHELSGISGQIDSTFELNDTEQRRLGMLRAIHVTKGTDLAGVTKPLKVLPTFERERIGKFALALVAADGIVTKEELKAIRKLYAAMGMQRDQADHALAQFTKPAASDEPVTVMAAIPGATGEAIPPAPLVNEVAGTKLDRAAIAAILKDTQDVSRMLAQAMSADQDDEPEVPETTPVSSPAPVPTAQITTPIVEVLTDPTVPARYASFYQVVVTREKWDRNDLSALAKQHGLMLAGAVEAINDWSTDKNGGPIIYEEDHQYTLESAYLN